MAAAKTGGIDVEKLKSKIVEARKTSRLNLSYYFLTEVSINMVMQIKQMAPTLQELDLRSNALSSLPPEMAELRNLKVLKLNYNRFIEFPKVVCSLPKLQVLELSGNQLADVDYAIGSLANLRELDLSGNKIQRLPPSFINLSSLISFNIGNNQLMEVPEHIDALPNLLRVDFSSNRLTRLPETIGNLPALVKLDLSGNQLTTVPTSIGYMKQLRELNVKNNELKEPWKTKQEMGFVKFMEYLREENERQKLEEMEKRKPVGVEIGPYMEYHVKSAYSECPVVRTGHTLVPGETHIYLWGGVVNQEKATELWRIDYQFLTWGKLYPEGISPAPRENQCAAIDQKSNRLFIFGGRAAERKRLNDFHYLDLQTVTWQKPLTDGAVPTPREGACMLVGLDGTIYVFGGHGSRQRLNDLFTLNPETWTWSQRTPIGTVPPPRQNAAMVMTEGRLFVHGGKSNQVMSDLHMLDLNGMIWYKVTVGGQVPPPRFGHVMTVDEDTIFIYGGVEDNAVIQPVYSLFKLDLETQKEQQRIKDMEEAMASSSLLRKKSQSHNLKDVPTGFYKSQLPLPGGSKAGKTPRASKRIRVMGTKLWTEMEHRAIADNASRTFCFAGGRLLLFQSGSAQKPEQKSAAAGTDAAGTNPPESASAAASSSLPALPPPAVPTSAAFSPSSAPPTSSPPPPPPAPAAPGAAGAPSAPAASPAAAPAGAPAASPAAAPAAAPAASPAAASDAAPAAAPAAAGTTSALDAAIAAAIAVEEDILMGLNTVPTAAPAPENPDVWDTFLYGNVHRFDRMSLEGSSLKRLHPKKKRIQITLQTMMDKLPASFTTISPKEYKLLEHVHRFYYEYRELYPRRGNLMLIAKNECNVGKFVCSTIRPSMLPYTELYNVNTCSNFVSEFLEYTPLEDPLTFPSHLPSPWSIVQWQVGDSFDFSVVLASLLIGVGYDAYCVAGYAPKHITLNILEYTDYPPPNQIDPLTLKHRPSFILSTLGPHVPADAPAKSQPQSTDPPPKPKYAIRKTPVLESKFLKDLDERAREARRIAAAAAAMVRMKRKKRKKKKGKRLYEGQGMDHDITEGSALEREARANARSDLSNVQAVKSGLLSSADLAASPQTKGDNLSNGHGNSAGRPPESDKENDSSIANTLPQTATVAAQDHTQRAAAAEEGDLTKKVPEAKANDLQPNGTDEKTESSAQKDVSVEVAPKTEGTDPQAQPTAADGGGATSGDETSGVGEGQGEEEEQEADGGGADDEEGEESDEEEDEDDEQKGSEEGDENEEGETEVGEKGTMKDELERRRMHSWVLVAAGRREVGESFFVEPTTGRFYTLKTSPYEAVEFVWNHCNFWINMQPNTERSGVASISWDFTNYKLWERVLDDISDECIPLDPAGAERGDSRSQLQDNPQQGDGSATPLGATSLVATTTAAAGGTAAETPGDTQRSPTIKSVAGGGGPASDRSDVTAPVSVEKGAGTESRPQSSSRLLQSGSLSPTTGGAAASEGAGDEGGGDPLGDLKKSGATKGTSTRAPSTAGGPKPTSLGSAGSARAAGTPMALVHPALTRLGLATTPRNHSAASSAERSSSKGTSGGGGGGDREGEDGDHDDGDACKVTERDMAEINHWLLPKSWVPKLVITREAFDTRCPRGTKLILYRRCTYEIFAMYGECARWDGLHQRVCFFLDDERTIMSECREYFQRRKDRLRERRTLPLEDKMQEMFDQGTAFGLREIISIAGVSRTIIFYPNSRLDGLVKREEILGQKMIETFDNRDDFLIYRSARYAPPDSVESPDSAASPVTVANKAVVTGGETAGTAAGAAASPTAVGGGGGATDLTPEPSQLQLSATNTSQEGAGGGGSKPELERSLSQSVMGPESAINSNSPSSAVAGVGGVAGGGGESTLTSRPASSVADSSMAGAGQAKSLQWALPSKAAQSTTYTSNLLGSGGGKKVGSGDKPRGETGEWSPPGFGSRGRASSVTVPVLPIAKMTEKLARNHDKRAQEDMKKRSFQLSLDQISVKFHYAESRITAGSRIYTKDGLSTITQVDPFEPRPKESALMDEYQKLLVAERKCMEAIRQSEKETLEIIEQRAKEEQSVTLVVPYYDVVRVKKEESDEDKEEEVKVVHDYLSPFLPTGPRALMPLSRKDMMEVRDKCLKALKDRLIQRANIIQARYDDETAALAKRQANFHRDRDQMTKEEEDEYELACEESLFRIHIIEKRLKRHEEQSLQKYYDLDAKLRSDPRLAGLTEGVHSPQPST